MWCRGVITGLDVMVQETSATVAGLNKLLRQTDRWRICSSRFMTRSLGWWKNPVSELHANSVGNAEVLHGLDERSHRQTEEASAKRWRRLWHRQVF